MNKNIIAESIGDQLNSGKANFPLQLQEICNIFNIGVPINTPIKVTGGLLHQMWKIETSLGSFAIKILNQEIMSRPEALNNYHFSEKVAQIVEKSTISVVSAININGVVIQRINDYYVMIFKWIDGTVLHEEAITELHARKIGQVLGNIHKLNVKSNFENLDNIPNSSVNRTDNDLVVSHRDIHLQNIIWVEDIPMIIDWESAGLINPTEELITVALDLAGQKLCRVNKALFIAVFEGYISTGAIVLPDIKQYLYGYLENSVNWLQYNIKRVKDSNIFVETDQNIAKSEIPKTIQVISNFYENINTYINWVKEIVR